jgi:hypothetical protein
MAPELFRKKPTLYVNERFVADASSQKSPSKKDKMKREKHEKAIQ